MSGKKESVISEWSHFVNITGVNEWPLKIELSPQESERAALVKRLGILALDLCKASVVINRDAGSQIVHVTGEFRAEIRQNCVVTMEPVVSEIHETFESWYADLDQAVSLSKARRDKQVEKGRSELPVLSEQEDPEPIIDGKIDIGELVAQYLSLSITSYPHAKGVAYQDVEEAVYDKDAEEICKSPFAALKDWKGKQVT